MRVLVAGAHGKVARHLVRMLSENGHEVRGNVRNEDHLSDVEADGAEAILCDLETEEVAGRIGETVEGCEAVVFAAGAGAGSGEGRKASMDEGGAVKLVGAAELRGARRYVMVSSMGTDDPESRDEAMRPYLRAKARADENLRASTLDYTIVRPGRLTDDPGIGTVAVAESLGRYGEIPREDVAAAIAAILEADNTFGKTVEILSGDTPVQQAIEDL